MAKVLLLDVETAPSVAFVWGLWDKFIPVSQLVEAGYTLCWAAKWLGDKKVMYGSVYEHGEKEMLKQMHSLMEEADIIITYNGNKFDLPILNKEFILNGLTPPAPYKSVDLLKVVRRQFRFTSNKLDYVCGALGLDTKVEHKGMSLWVGCMDGDAKSWKIMERYNKRDVKILEQLYEVLLPWIPNHPSVPLYRCDESLACNTCGSHNVQRRGYHHTAVGVYPRFRCKDCGAWGRGRKQAEDRKVTTQLVRAK